MREILMMPEEKIKYIRLLAEKYPSDKATFTEIINLQAILNLPKGTEHFISDLHGEYDAFCHILNNCSGVIREKVRLVFKDLLNEPEQAELCTLIYYPKEKLEMVKKEQKDTPQWYTATLQNLIELAKFLSSKYTRSKVHRALPKEFSYIIDELMHAQPDEDNNQLNYHAKIVEAIINTDCCCEFIHALAALIKRLAVDRLHIVGDIFDRGAHADKIIDMLMNYHSLDIEWGNHDILWMGAAAGSEACIAAAIRNNIAYGNMEILESGYGISLRSLMLFAQSIYPSQDIAAAALKSISILLFKLEGQIIKRRPEYDMGDRFLLDKIDFKNRTVTLDGKVHTLEYCLPTVDPAKPYELTREEEALVAEWKIAFKDNERLNRHIRFLYAHGSMYRCFNENLLFHGCIPLDSDGNFEGIQLDGEIYQGKALLDHADLMARKAYFEKDDSALDFIWYLWCGKKSPLSGRTIKTFERTLIKDSSTWIEPMNPYYIHCRSDKICNMILREFGLYSPYSHIINGHTPVRAIKGESPVKAGGKLIVIDGGFCKAYQKSTGIAGYTLIFNSHGMRIKSHKPFDSVERVLTENKDIESQSETFETRPERIMVADTDNGKKIAARIADLEALLIAYRAGIV